MKFWFSEKQQKIVQKERFVLVYGELIAYTEYANEKSNFDDAVVVAEIPKGTKVKVMVDGVINKLIARN